MTDVEKTDAQSQHPEGSPDPAAKQAGAAAAPTGPRPLQTLVLLGIALGVLALMYGWLSWSGNSRLSQELIDWRAQGGKTTLVELAPPTLEKEENAAVHYVDAFKALPTLNQAQVAVLVDPWNAPEPALAQVLGSCAMAIDHARLGSAKVKCQWPVNYGSPDEMQKWRDMVLQSSGQLASMLSAQAVLQLRTGDAAAAMASIVDGLVLADYLMVDAFLPNLIEQIRIQQMMLEVLERGFDQTDLPSASRLAPVLARQDYRQELRQALMNEGAFTLTAYSLPDFRDRLVQSMAVAGRELPWWYVAAMIPRDMAYYLDVLAADAQILSNPWHAQTSPTVRQHPWWAQMVYTNPADVPDLNAFVADAQALAGLSQLALRLRQYKAEHQGQYPDDLSVIVQAPVDPYTGKSFQYQKQAEGFILSSAGAQGRPGPQWRWSR